MYLTKHDARLLGDMITGAVVTLPGDTDAAPRVEWVDGQSAGAEIKDKHGWAGINDVEVLLIGLAECANKE
jgi:hypothetical protein